MKTLMNDLMSCIGGQTKINCSCHKLPLITNKDKNEKCYHISSQTSNTCNHKMTLVCPDLKCKYGMCKGCYQLAVDQEHEFVDPPRISSNPLSGGGIITSIDSYPAIVSDDSSTEDSVSTRINEHPSSEFDDLIVPTEDDDFNDFVMDGGDDVIPLENVEPELFPTDIVGNHPFIIEEDTPKGDYVSGHIIMNQCGSLLNRKERDIIGYRSQKHFQKV